MEEKEPVSTIREELPQEQAAQAQAEEVVEEVKQEVDKRDDLILQELRNIHNDMMQHNEHLVRHLESHTTAPDSPVQETAQDVSEQALPQEPVSLEISEPKDMVKEEKKEHKRRKAFGKKR